MVYIFQLRRRQRCHSKAGSKLRHWPPGTNSKTFVPSFFALQKILLLKPFLSFRLFAPLSDSG